MKTIADIAYEHLIESDNWGVMWGDCALLDEIAWKCTHTNLKEKHPLIRHKRILDALDRDSRFEKSYIHVRGSPGPLWRCFKIIVVNERQNIRKEGEQENVS